MKIIQLLPELNEGGVERGTVELCRELIKKGFESIVISNGGKLVDQIAQDGGLHVKLDVCSKNIFTAPWRIFKLYKILKQLQPDILHVRSRVPAWMVCFANKLLKIPVVSTVHGFNSVNAYSSIMTKADYVICSSSFLIKHIIKNFNTDKEKIHLIPRGIDFNYFNNLQLDTEFITEFKKENMLTNQRIILHVARITRWKDQATTIRAFLEVRKTIENIKLVLVGGTDLKRQSYHDNLKSLIENSPYKQDIVFAGSHTKIKEIYSLATIAISSSTKPETFGRANVEGLAMGVPLLATQIGATVDYIIEGKTGFFFNLEDYHELANLMQKSLDYPFNPAEIKLFAKENFSLDQMVEKTINVYSKVTH